MDLNSSNFSDWSQCSRECGGGIQIKVQDNCYGSHCGNTVVQRACNVQACPGQWACWGGWSACDLYGKRNRVRNCQASNSVLSGEVSGPLCPSGPSYEEEPCGNNLRGWSEWSKCDLATETRTRTRTCVDCAENQHTLERQACTGSDLNPLPVNSTSSDLLAVACICCFVLGAGLGAGLVLYFLKFRRSNPDGSSHYVSAKSQNLYVSLPMLDLTKHTKNLSTNQSDCGTLRSTSTLRSKAGSSVYSPSHTNGIRSDYETATIKRSHSHRNSSLIGVNSSTLMRADLDSDTLFT